MLRRQIESQNLRDKQHWSARGRDMKAWLYLLRVALRGNRTPPAGKVAVAITSLRARKLDLGNLVGGAKGLVDAMVHVGLLADDSDDHVAITYQQLAVKKPLRGTIIEIGVP